MPTPLTVQRDAAIAAAPRASARIEEYLADHAHLPTPYLVMDLDIVDSDTTTAQAIPEARVYFAVKANPAPEVLRVLAAAGSCFDVASIGEIALCQSLGIGPERLSFGNTIKKESAIAAAYAAGCDLRGRRTRAN